MQGWGPPWSHMARGRRRGWLRPLVLSLLAKRPMNGMELMEEIYRLTGGLWRPSPGSIYPTLAELSDEGFISRRDDGRYELTERGLQLAQTLYMPLASALDPLVMLDNALTDLEEQLSESPTMLKDKLQRLLEARRRLDAIIEKLKGQAGP
ncbi:PadR family transcriptional regulator [Acidilobus saccharovorans]|nr:PadR family transcriptional regulator [Acidilobus saccharovorans]